MKRHCRRGGCPARGQRGFAIIAILLLLALMSAYLIANGLSRTSAELSNERERHSMDALRQAKAALIAYAASDQWQQYKSCGTLPVPCSFQPGALLCPDTDDDGDSQGICSGAVNRIGRLPWKTLGIDDLRDASGERLWYALSSNFRKLPGTTVINSDTQGQLTVIGAAPASQVVAIVFAPGVALQGQIRDPANAIAHNDPASYLEGFNAGYDTFTTTALPSDTFNDRLIVITQADLMSVVEPVVAARIERDVKPLLQDYFSKWGAYPYPVLFAAPPPAGQGTYLGVSGQTKGLLPLTNTATFTWQNPTVTQIFPGGTGSSTVDAVACSISSNTVTCTVHYTGFTTDDRPDIRLEVFLANASIAFADAPSSATATEDLDMFKGGGGSPPTYNSAPYGWWSDVGSFTPTLKFVAQPGGGALTYTGRLQNALQMNNQAKIVFPLPAPPGYLSRLTNAFPANPNITWFTSNQWYRQTYYAVSPGFAPGGVPSGNPAACNPLPGTPPCLTVNNLPAPRNDKQAILVFAGRALNGSPRLPPTTTIADYLENANLAAALGTTPFVYEHRAGVPTAINDRVVVVSP